MPHPTTRVLAVLELLQCHGRISGSEMAQRLDVDVRTLRRYIAMLEELGIPVVAERGRYGAYALVAGFKLPPMMFTDDEALALSVGLLAVRSLGLAGAAHAVASAQAKLERVMPDKLKRRIRAVDETVRIDLAHTVTPPDDNAALVVLTAAAQAQQRVHMRYRSEQGVETQRDVDPYGLAWRGGAWYMVGMCHLRHDLRSFRLDRVLRAEPIESRFVRPAGFDALDRLTEGIATMHRATAVEVLLHADLQTAQREFSPAIGLFMPVRDGVLLRSRTDHLAWFARQLARLPFAFEIRKPQRLRTELARHLARLQSMTAKP